MATERNPDGTGRSADFDCARRLDRLLRDIEQMATYATSRGMVFEEALAAEYDLLCACVREGVENGTARSGGEGEARTVSALAQSVHGHLCALVAPASPMTLRETQRLCFGFLVRNSAVTVLVFLAAGSLALFVLCMIRSSHQMVLALAAAGLGASFFSLSKAREFLINRTFDPQYNQIYIIRFVLGLTAGVILATFARQLFTGEFAETLSSSLLALVGGYSADAVRQVLERTAETLVTAVRGGTEEVLRAREEELAAAAKATRAELIGELQAQLYAAKEEAAKSDPDGTVSAKIQETIEQLNAKLKGRRPGTK